MKDLEFCRSIGCVRCVGACKLCKKNYCYERHERDIDDDNRLTTCCDVSRVEICLICAQDRC